MRSKRVQIFHFLFRNLHHLQSMQLMLTHLHCPTRPLLKKKGEGFDLQSFGVQEHEIKYIVESMKANKKNLRNIKHWTLQQGFLQDWTVSKKPDRDYIKYALAAKLEESYVDQYRQQLFDDCKSAQWIRWTLLQQLQPNNIKVRPVGIGQSAGVPPAVPPSGAGSSSHCCQVKGRVPPSAARSAAWLILI